MPNGKPTDDQFKAGKSESATPPSKPPGYQRFGVRLKQLRSSRGMTLERAARAVGTHKGYISGIENGKVSPPSPRFISKFARFYQADEKELLRLAYAEKAPKLIKDEIIRALWPDVPSQEGMNAQ